MHNFVEAKKYDGIMESKSKAKNSNSFGMLMPQEKYMNEVVYSKINV